MSLSVIDDISLLNTLYDIEKNVYVSKTVILVLGLCKEDYLHFLNVFFWLHGCFGEWNFGPEMVNHNSWVAEEKEKGRDLTQSYNKKPLHSQKKKTTTTKNKQLENRNTTKNFDYTMIKGRPRTTSFDNDSYQTGVV